MSSTAISAQGSQIFIAGTAGSSISITAISKATQAVVTATNTLAVNDIVIFGVVAGMPEINGRIGVVKVASGTSFTVALDSSGFASAGTTGAAVPQTFTKIKNFKDYTGFDGSATEIDVTNLDSLAMENRQGLQDFGQFSMTLDTDNTDPGQLALHAAKTAGSYLPFKLLLPNGAVRSWIGWVKKFSETAGVNKVFNASCDIRISGEVVYA